MDLESAVKPSLGWLGLADSRSPDSVPSPLGVVGVNLTNFRSFLSSYIIAWIPALALRHLVGDINHMLTVARVQLLNFK